MYFYINFFFAFLLSTVLLQAQQESAINISAPATLKELIEASVPFRSDGKINIPTTIGHIKLDIGLFYNAPMSQYWLSHDEENLWVFGFEPIPETIDAIFHDTTKRNPIHGDLLEKKFIGKRFFLIPCALGLATSHTTKFFVTPSSDCSSIYVPKCFDVSKVIEVPIFSLSEFFDIFPFDTHPIIDYIKIDAQGADLDIAKSAGRYLPEHVVYITLEAENAQYENTSNSYEMIDEYMQKLGFVRYTSRYTCDPTYFNPRFADYVNKHKISIYQQG